MREKKMIVDHRRDQVTVPLGDLEPKAVLISKGQAQCVELPDYGELVVKVHDGEIKQIYKTEKVMFK